MYEWLGPLIGAGTSALGGILGRENQKETPIQKQQRELVDQLLGSLRGNGPYSDLFHASDADFERSFAEPARSRFRNITAPQIQQSYIASGQHRGTGLEDTLARAGVDMDSILNQNYLDYKQGAQNRQVNAIGNILGQNSGVPEGQSWWEGALQGVGDFAGGPAFGQGLENILSSFNRKNPNRPSSKGFEQEETSYNPYLGANS